MHAKGFLNYRNISGWELSAVHVNLTKLNVNLNVKATP